MYVVIGYFVTPVHSIEFPFNYLWRGMLMLNDPQATDKATTSRKYSYASELAWASELGNLSHFDIHPIFSLVLQNILSVL